VQKTNPIKTNKLKMFHQNIGLYHFQYFNVFHQNIRGLREKTNELLSHLHPASPQILCFTEHHMNFTELQLINIDSYKLGANYCITLYKKGGVCIYVQKKLYM
jgi:hypothetical protein